jgi:hypothetical protein
VRGLSTDGKKMAAASRTGDGPLVCVTITHPDLAEPIYVINDIKPVTRDGHDFLALPFRITLPDERKDQLPEATLELDNVERSVGQAILALATKPSITVEIVRIKSKVTVEQGPWSMKLVSCTINRLVIQGRLGMPGILTEPYPGNTYNPATFPQLFDI